MPESPTTTHHDVSPGSRPDEAIRRLALSQHGVVARWQLLDAGVPAHLIEYRLKTGRLRRLHRGIYLAGTMTGQYGREMAAVLACGDQAVLSHRTAGALWELVPPSSPEAAIDVTGPRGIRGPGVGVRLRRVRRLHSDEVAIQHGLPVTAPARTLLDLAALAKPEELERALARAERRRLVTHDGVEVLLARHPSRLGRGALAAVLRQIGGPALTRSEAEARFLSLVRRAALPQPASNAVVEGYEVDFSWRSRRLVVEIDGYAFHRGRSAFELDRQRDAQLAAAGFRVLRITWRQLTRTPEAVLVRLTRALTPGGLPEA